MTRLRIGIAVVVFFAPVLWYLRDPSWVKTQTTGMRQWERRAPDGTRWRWTDGHASFFVPADAATLRLRVGTSFEAREPLGMRPMLVTFTIDDQRAARLILSEPGWHEVLLPLPPKGGRRVRRVDIRTNITREGNFGVQIGEPEVSRDGLHWRRCCFAED